MPERVSILIPAYNAGRWLAESIASALAQQGPAIEVVVADDGSTDASLRIARAFAEVRVLALPHRGAAAARNAALGAARGDYIQFLDADDLLAPGKLAAQVAALEASGNPALLASCAWSPFIGRPGESAKQPDALWQDLSPLDWLVAKFEHNAYMVPAAWLASRRLIERAGRWDESLSLDDDGDFFGRLVAASDGVRFVAEAQAWRRVGLPGSLSHARSAEAMESAWRALRQAIGRLLAMQDSPRTRAACLRVLQDNLGSFEADAPALADACRALALHLGGRLGPPLDTARFEAMCRLVGRARARRWRDRLNRWRWHGRRLAARWSPPPPSSWRPRP